MRIVTLVAPGSLDRETLFRAADRISATEVGAILDGRAAQLRTAVPQAEARVALEALLEGVDVLVRDDAAPLPRLIVADMDSTMITVECIDELADYAGIKPAVAEITERAMRGELDFPEALAARVRLLEGLPAGIIDRCLTERVRLAPGARTMVRTFRSLGAKALLVSGGFTRFAEPVAAMLGMDAAIANQLEVEDRALTGRVTPPIVDAGTKLATLEREVAGGVDRSAVLAIGDGANDAPMLRAAGFAVAYRPHAIAAEAAHGAIRHTDHRATLYAYGLAEAAWIRD